MQHETGQAEAMPTIQGDMLTWRAVYHDGTIDYEYGPDGGIDTRYNEIRFDELTEFHVLFALQRLEGLEHGAPFLRIHVPKGARILWRKRTRMRAKNDELVERIYLVGLRQRFGGIVSAAHLGGRRIVESILYASFEKGVAFRGIRLSDTENDIEYYPWELFPEEMPQPDETVYLAPDEVPENEVSENEVSENEVSEEATDEVRGISKNW